MIWIQLYARYKCSVNGSVLGLAAVVLGSRSKIAGIQIFSVLSNIGGCMFNVATEQHMAANGYNYHPETATTPYIDLCVTPCWKINILMNNHVIFAVAASFPYG